jgi:hypothetical protein
MDYERVALWVIVIILLIKVFLMTRRSYAYVGTNPPIYERNALPDPSMPGEDGPSDSSIVPPSVNGIGIMDLAEFKNLPDGLKTIWQTNIVNKLLPVVGTKVSSVWTAYGTANQTELSTNITAGVDKLIENINEAPIELTK